MCNSAQWWVAYKSGELPPRRLWALLLLLGFNYSYVAINHLMYAFQAFQPQPGAQTGCVIEQTANCSGSDVHPTAGDTLTIVTEWSLVGSRAYLRPAMSTLYFLGVAIGALVCGLLADRIGRRTVMLTCLLGQAVLGVAVSRAPSLEVFALCKTLLGFFVQGLQLSTFTLLLELSPKQHGAAVVMVLELYWALGLLALSGLGYLLPDWRDLQLAVSLPGLATLLFVRWIPESRLWHVAREHKPPFSRGLPGHGSYRENKDDGDGVIVIAEPLSAPQAARAARTASSTSVGVWDLFRKGGLWSYTLCTMCMWFAVPLSYYVVTIGLPALAGNRFTSFAVGAAMEIVAYCGTFVVVSRIGRSAPMVTFLVCSAVTCFAAAGIRAYAAGDGGKPTLVLVLVCKTALVCAFYNLFLYTGELFPTGTRSAAVGICGFVGRIATLLAAVVVHLGDGGRPWLPLVLMGPLLLIAALTAFMLPETLGRGLPSSVEEAKALRLPPAPLGPLAEVEVGVECKQLLEQGAVPCDQIVGVKLRNGEFNRNDYKMPPWASDVTRSNHGKSKSFQPKLKESMSALELGRTMLEELYKTPDTRRVRSYLETNLDEAFGEELQELTTFYKPKVVSSAV